MRQKKLLAKCSTCTHRKLDFGHGFVCQLTGKVADFEKNCMHFESDETVTDTIKIRTEERVMDPLFKPDPVPEGTEKAKVPAKKAKRRRLTKDSLKKLRKYQSFLYAVTGGLLVTVFSVLAWTGITVTTGYQGVYMALGVGLLVGLGVRFFGAGIYKVFGILAAVLTLAGSLLGNYLSQTDFLAALQSSPGIGVLDYFRPDLMLNTMLDAFVPLDLLSYCSAILLGYLLAIRRVRAKKLAKLERGDYNGAPALYWLRLPLILAGILLPAYYGYTMTTQSSDGPITNYYPSGEKMSEGELQKGMETGKWTWWHDNGNLKSTGYYSAGQQDSLWQWFNESGQLTRTGIFRDGVENGTWMYYFDNGEISDSGAYRNGLETGLWKYWYENGRLKSAVTFKAGKRDGKRSLWSDSGKLVKEDYYEEGKLLSTP
ncbi:MAG: toxin-antitoxin system YwqK family antitoxin [Bacteroidota bacterium]